VAQDPAAGARVTPGSKVHLNISKGSATVDVPSELGMTVDQAQSDLAAKGFKATVTNVPSDQPAGTVVAQSPTGGQARKGSNVQLNVSKGQTPTTTDTTTVTTETTETETDSATVTAPTTPTTTESTATTGISP
jgi:beta-lactam-binding protein with PASTA domain